MNYYKTLHPTEYQKIFYQENGLLYSGETNQIHHWNRSDGSYIHTFGSMDTLQCGVGSYSITSDFFVEYQYDTIYLHFGIIYQGTTYSVVENKLVKDHTPSSFLAMEKAYGSVNHWKSGQTFQGIEMSIEQNYLKKVLLPFLGYPKEALDFMSENIRYRQLPLEMTDLLRKMERLILTDAMTLALQRSLALEFLSYLLHPRHQALFNCQGQFFQREITVGKRKIKLTHKDLAILMQIHQKIQDNATNFHTIYELSQEFGISEQKLKHGFREIYQISLWDYANQIRMNLAVHLLSETDQSVLAISQQVGYQSQAAFINMFKKWCNMTPGQFRMQLHPADSSSTAWPTPPCDGSQSRSNGPTPSCDDGQLE